MCMSRHHRQHSYTAHHSILFIILKRLQSFLNHVNQQGMHIFRLRPVEFCDYARAEFCIESGMLRQPRRICILAKLAQNLSVSHFYHLPCVYFAPFRSFCLTYSKFSWQSVPYSVSYGHSDISRYKWSATFYFWNNERLTAMHLLYN